MVNAALLQETLEHIKANPEQWGQRSWFWCSAGTTLKVSGVEPMDFDGGSAAVRLSTHERPPARPCLATGRVGWGHALGEGLA